MPIDTVSCVLILLILNLSSPLTLQGNTRCSGGGILEVLESSDLGSIRQELVAVREAIEQRLAAATRSEADMLRQHEQRIQAVLGLTRGGAS